MGEAGRVLGQKKRMNIYISPNILIIFGLACNIIGAVLISLEAFGIKEFIEKLHDESTYEHRLVATSYIAMVNEFSVFVLVNCLWVIALVVFPTASKESVIFRTPSGRLAISAIPPAVSVMGP